MPSPASGQSTSGLPISEMAIAIIIPTWQEAETIGPCLQALASQAPPFEVIVTDGGSTDGTQAVVAALDLPYPVRWTISPQRGRAAQMNWGAQQTQAELLLFLHADTYLDPQALAALREAGQWRGVVGGCFQVKLDSDAWPYSLISWGINARSVWSQAFTGDMGIFVRRSVFEKLGGYQPLPLMEDLALSEQLRRVGDIARLPLPITTSARRWQKKGPWRTVFLMQGLRLGYRLGVSPSRLARWYASVR